MFKVAPLSSSFMLVSMFGFIISAFFLTHPVFMTWAWAFMFAFVFMFISSMISLGQTELEPHDLKRLAIHDKDHFKK